MTSMHSLVAEEASLLQAVEVQTEPVAERQRQITANSNSPLSRASMASLDGL